MSSRASRRRRGRRRRLLALGLGALLALTGLVVARGGAPRAAALEGEGEPTPQTDASVPASNVTLIGSAPLEAPGETWGIGQANDGTGALHWILVRYDGSGWSLGPGLLDSEGQPLSGFVPGKLKNVGTASPLAGQMTPAGSGVLVGTVPASGHSQQVVLVRDPGGSFQETPPVPVENSEPGSPPGLLKSGEALLGATRAPLVAPLDEAGGHAGALVVPVVEQGPGVEDGVLHWDGKKWTREPIAIPAASNSSFRVLAVGASSPSHAWLLGQLANSSSYPAGAVALFRRHVEGEAASWQPVAPSSGGAPGEPLAAPAQTPPPASTAVSEPFTVPGTGDPPSVVSQILTVTSEGVWIDGVRSDVSASTTLFFKPAGEADSGSVTASWCKLSSGVPQTTATCQYPLPEGLPTGPSRSIAWADPSNSSGFGQRVIAGFPEGVSLRLDGSSFTRVLALGGSQPTNDVGGTFGAAFSSPREGWLGNQLLPVHLTLSPIASRLTPYPVPFRHTLVAIAPEPGAPIGSLSSEALAVGDQGQVARYTPGKGWLPESLLAVGGRRATPRLRSIAWPTPTRAYAVGDHGQMWRWEAETGLWEPDPATPFNFRGNLTGIAFSPGNSACGVAIGEEGLLLSYGKTWTPQSPPEGLAKATFTSVAFAGPEAIVAYHVLPEPSTNRYIGGLLKAVCRPDGQLSSWEVDAGAAAAMGKNVPWAVAGLPDGGAAFSAGDSSGEGTGGLVFEREGPGAPWQVSATPFPGGLEPGSLTLFREGGALRAVASGSVPNTYEQESAPAPPPGFPPNLIPPYPLSAGYGAGHVVRQTASGWSDEEHELNDVHEPPGNYAEYDMVYQPDPISAVLVDPTGKEGWAVGGFVDTVDPDGALDTAEVARYPADGVTPPGLGVSAIPTRANMATFAIGGGAQCMAPCADRANAHIGPDAWLSSALARSAQISGVRDFIYTGPRLTNGSTSGPATLAIPYERELARYAGLLAASPIEALAAPSPTDLVGGGLSAFRQAFAGTPSAGKPSACPNPVEQAAYYAFASEGAGGAGTVKVIVLDDSADVGTTQLGWLEECLREAKRAKEPAIVVGDADLDAEIEAHDAAAATVAQALIAGSVSAYFYDSPEQNVKRPLLGGSIETYGSGTLGYVNHVAENSGAFLGASGFLLVEVDALHANPSTGQAPVSVTLIPNIGELALEGKDGTLLRRSQAALFEGLARRPRAGNRSQNQANQPDTDPYIPIPSNCIGAACAEALLPAYSFSSSRPDIGNFVKRNAASADPHAVLLSYEEPIPDPNEGLFCAYNAGTTIVTITAGGLSSSLPVTVQAGSVERPCGTHKLEPPGGETISSSTSAPTPTPTPTPAATPAGPAPVPLPVPPLPAPPAPSPPPAPAPLLAFVPPLAPLLPPRVFVPLPLPTVARPTPPSGTSSVFQTEPIAEEQREEEEAIESASASAAYSSAEHEPVPLYVLGVVVLAAFAGATTARRRPRRGRRELRAAPATLTTMRTQRRIDREARRMR